MCLLIPPQRGTCRLYAPCFFSVVCSTWCVIGKVRLSKSVKRCFPFRRPNCLKLRYIRQHNSCFSFTMPTRHAFKGMGKSGEALYRPTLPLCHACENYATAPCVRVREYATETRPSIGAQKIHKPLHNRHPLRHPYQAVCLLAWKLLHPFLSRSSFGITEIGFTYGVDYARKYIRRTGVVEGSRCAVSSSNICVEFSVMVSW